MTGWTPALVLEELTHAFEVDDALPVRIGPKAFGSSMPEYRHETADWFMAGAEADRETKEARNRKVLRRARVSASEVSRAERSFEWVTAYVFDADLREALLAYAMVKARKWEWSRYVRQRNRRKAQEKPWAKRTVYRWIAYAEQQVADALNKRAVPLPPGVDLQMAHMGAKTSPDPDKTGSGAWLAPGKAA